MNLSRTRLAPLALVAAVFALVSFVPSHAAYAAQTAPPDIRGSYLLSGASTIYGCVEFPQLNTTYPVPSAKLDITTQDGSQWAGRTFDNSNPTTPGIQLSGNVDANGGLTGTWLYEQTENNDAIVSRTLTGNVANGRAALTLYGDYAQIQDSGCKFRVDLASESAVLTWLPPDETSGPLAPPRALTIGSPVSSPAALLAAAKARAPQDSAVAGYNVYKSSQPGVQPTPENLYTQVPPSQTTIPTTVATSGSFFVVTATYPAGESGPSNEVSGGVPAAKLTSVKVVAGKVKAVGSGFSSQVQVFVDGIPFALPAKVKGGLKVNQKGNLITGQSIAQYATNGKTVAITFRNANGGVATYLYTAP